MTTGRINQVTSLLPALQRREARARGNTGARRRAGAPAQHALLCVKGESNRERTQCFQPLCVWVVQTRAQQAVALVTAASVPRRSGAVLISSFHNFPRRARAAQSAEVE